MREDRVAPILDYIRTGLSILAALAFLTTCVVGSIVYVSSNANNADLVLIKWRLAKIEEALTWTAEVRPVKPFDSVQK